MPEVSIIVPVYNVEKYINKCIDSILNQTFEDFELILVDDGSTDNSGEICDEYKLKDERIKVIHKVNGGLSSARNTGIEASSGSFLGFVDSDDHIEKDMYQTLYDDMKEFDTDVSICQMYDEYGKNHYPRKYGMDRCALDNILSFKLTLEMQIFTVHAVDKLYKKKLFSNIRFPEGKIYEDAFIVPKIIFNSKRVSYNPLPKYFYVHHEDSITMSPYKSSDLCIIEAYNEILSFTKKNAPNLEDLAYFRYLYANATILDKMIIVDDFKNIELLNKILNLIRSNALILLKSNLFSMKKKIKVLFLIISPNLYRFVLKSLNMGRK